MKDPIVMEIHQIRREHTQRFNGDMYRICEDLRKTEQGFKERLVKLAPRQLFQVKHTGS